ncbi:fructosamine kinase family protein [sulfur-oxidizing endosymbiont of Gigantopelta aegis]|uniref:fructosamine kinase family protein n=1 Tax=sulfur-oxidizing endosymbiont of Gigantopelta aegis TaxID=2794934 RepID=UPI0018DC32D9|nr:fructosamine kinase family protein [sulfur-oxidizing endosymbiont of Gigantopelta aegis]
MIHWQPITEHISQTLNISLQLSNHLSVGGGSINSCYQITGTDGQEFFVKLNSIALESMFQVEFDALNELSQALSNTDSAIRVPEPICFGHTDNNSYLVLEYLPLDARGNHQAFGIALAKMHQITAKQHGWYQNNVIGSTPQSNAQHPDWLTFWREQRLLPQFNMLYDKGHKRRLQPLADILLEQLSTILDNHQPVPSLLHGDLWSGNYAFQTANQPVLFDPALYYGDRETDMAMTELFGGFSADFYQAYQATWPLDEGYQQRKTLYNLYHILNHANLFGSSYLNQAISMIEKLCKSDF